MNIQEIKHSFGLGNMNLEQIEWLIDSYERHEIEYATLLESVCECDVMLSQQQDELKQYKQYETILLARLEKQAERIKELKLNSRLIKFYELAEENLKLVTELAEIKGGIIG